MHQFLSQCCIVLCLSSITLSNQVFAQGDDHGNNCDTGTVVDLNTLTTASRVDIPSILTENDQDFFLIEVPEPFARVGISTRGGIPTAASLTDSSGILIQEETYGGADGAFLIDQRLDAGTYCLQVVGDYPTNTGNYALTIDADVPSDDHGNNCDSATYIGKTAILGEIAVFGDVDYFKIQVPNPGSEITFTTVSNGQLATTATLVDKDNILITEETYGGSNGQFLITRTLSAGIYCLGITSDYYSSDGSIGEYTLQITETFTPAGSCSVDHVAISAGTLAFGRVLPGGLSSARLVTVTNISTVPLHRLIINRSFISGTDSADFGVLNDRCAGKILLEGETCTVSGVFAPLTTGAKIATLSIPCNDLDTLPFQISLSGEGLPPAP